MDVRLVYFQGCPHWRLAADRLRRAIDYAGVGRVSVELVPVTTEAQARDTGLCGSPTILIDGADAFGVPQPPLGRSCRIYSTENGLDGAPGVLQMVEALRRACEDPSDLSDTTGAASSPASDPPETCGPEL